MTYQMHSRVPPAETKTDIAEEFRKWRQSAYGEPDVGDYDFPLRLDKSDESASVRFVLRGTPVTVQCSSQYTFRDNIRCVFYAVQAMRMNEKRGIADTMANAYAQLAAPASARDPYEVLGVRPDAPIASIEAVYKELAKTHHPRTKGADDTKMTEINAAMDRIKADRNGA